MSQKKENNGQQALELEALLRKIGKVDLDKVQEVERSQLPQMEQLIISLEEGGDFIRKMKDRTGVGRTRSTPKVHHSTLRARRRKKYRDYYHTKGRVLRRQATAKLLSTPEGWWKHITQKWREKGVEVLMTEEEWLTVVWPTLEGNVPVITRYNPGLPISLDNLLVYKSNSRTVLFDGKEWKLKELGYIL